MTGSMAPGSARENAVAYSRAVKGWYTDVELDGLWEMCLRAVRHRGIVEVGCFHGRSSSLFAHFAKGQLSPVPLTFIDPFLPWKAWDLKDAKRYFQRHMTQIGVAYRLIEKRTAEIEREDLPIEADLIHIDGDHLKTSVETDCRVLFPLLRPGGVVCFHDYRPDFEVMDVVNRLCAGWPIAGTFGSMRSLVKP